VSGDEQRDKGGSVNLSGLLAVLLLVAGAVWINLPLDGQRPPQAPAGFRLSGVQDVDARLWQDPFAAVARARERERALLGGSNATKVRKAGTKDLHHANMLARQVLANAQQSIDKRVAVLGVMVFGEQFVGAEEYRRRTRYAVLSGLMSLDYSPFDPEHVGYVDAGLGRGYPESIPYEWFYKSGEKPLLLLWLDESSLLQESPSAAGGIPRPRALRRLAEVLKRTLGKGEQVTDYIDIIGPAGSEMLTRIASELGGYHDNPAQDGVRLDKIGFFSPFATMSDHRLARSFLSRRENVTGDYAECLYGADACSMEGLVGGLRVFVRMNAPDEALAAAVIGELRRRRVGADHHIAIVSERDTAYARELAAEIELSHKKNAPLSARTLGDGDAVSHNTVHRFTYLRGIDGRVPDASAVNGEGKKSSDKQRDSSQVERPDGDAQVDYLRRLAATMKQHETRLTEEARAHRPWHERKRTPFRAIGIVGNDYYDKLLVMQALRPVFPDAIFFTTDLYAAMLHPVDNRALRNVIVGSGFGLTLHPKLQRETPPFRDSYQSAAYLATLVALQAGGKTDALTAERAEKWLNPRLWEVGRTRFFELEPPRPDSSCSPNPLHCENPYGDRYEEGGLPWWALLIIVAFAAAFALVVSAKLRLFTATLLRSWWFYALVIPVAVASVHWFLLPAVRDSGGWSGEPFAWFEGVSVWPSSIVRFAALLIAILSLVCTLTAVHARVRETDAKFFDVLPDHPPPDASYADSATHWKRYRRSMHPLRILGCAFIEFAFLFLLCLSIFVLSGAEPTSPSRSETAFWVTDTIVRAAVMATLYLVAVVVVIIRGTNRLVDHISKKTWWATAVRQRYGLPADRHGVLLDDWLDLQVIARQTEAVNRLVYWPFLALLLIVLARFTVFDNWSTQVELIVVMAISFLYLITATAQLRSTAERARTNALRALERKLIKLQDNGAPSQAAAQCRTLLEQVQKFNRGAFLPFTQQPLMRAILALAGGVSGAAILEYAALANF
jgi:hypothetical protein